MQKMTAVDGQGLGNLSRNWRSGFIFGQVLEIYQDAPEVFYLPLQPLSRTL
jgi:hypothetical protein